MQGSGVSAVSAYTAHREWASRPPDERYQSVQALHDAARARRLRTEERTIDSRTLRTEAVASDALVLHGASGRTARLTHWSFEQLAGHRQRAAEIPPVVARADRLGCDQRGPCTAGPRAASALCGPRRPMDRSRDHLAEVRAGPPRRAGRPGARPQASHPAWHLPLGYKDGEFGAERVPSGAYLGDRDMFLFLVDGNRDLDDPTDSHPCRPVPRVHPPEQRCGSRRPHPGCVPLPNGLRESRAPCHRRMSDPT